MAVFRVLLTPHFSFFYDFATCQKLVFRVHETLVCAVGEGSERSFFVRVFLVALLSCFFEAFLRFLSDFEAQMGAKW